MATRVTRKYLIPWLGTAAFLLGGGFGQSWGQAPEEPASMPGHSLPTKFLVKTPVFNLPFKIDPGTVPTIREMQLWCRSENGTWKIMDRVPPGANLFKCRVDQDGEYGFSIVTVSRRGGMSPADVRRRPPELTVVVQVGTPAGPAPGPALPAPDALLPPPRITDISESSLPLPTVTDFSQPVPEMIPEEPKAAPASTAKPQAGGAVLAKEAPALFPEAAGPSPVLVEPAPAPKISFSKPDHKTQANGLVNNPQVCLAYNVNKVGPSGLSKVEIYLTSDQGLTWKRLGEDSDLRSPAEITLPGEGIFGVRLVGINGNGFGKPPGPGDTPSTTLEVDLTPPKIQAWKVNATKNGKLEIVWKTIDKNLGNEPINLFYSGQRQGPWQPLGLKLKNEGFFRCSIPTDLPEQFFVRLEVADLAGNIARSETPNPVALDRTEPDINVIGITVQQGPADLPLHVVPAGIKPE